jgi:PTS system ascorbate-specific IIA component
MSAGLLIIAHGDVGAAMLRQVEINIGTVPPGVAAVTVDPQADPDEVRATATHLATRLDSGEGLVIVTDLFGATPSNIAHSLHLEGRSTLVHGLNLAMLIRACNYRDRDLDELTEIMIEGGRRSIFSGDAPQ